MKTLYFVSLCDDEVGEMQGFFDAQGNLLDSWCMNDAIWRSEYFDDFLNKLGYNVNYDCHEKLQKKLKDHWMKVIYQ